MPDDRPLIVSLRLDDEAQQRFDALRRAHFPPERLVVGAHVTLFHALPAGHEERVREALQRAAGCPPFPLQVARVRSLGRGVAFDLAAPELVALHARLQAELPDLTPQDRQRLSAHVTVQNKATPERARALLEQLRAGFVPYEVRALGLDLWRYDGGPWQPAGRYPFRQEQP